ncbi:GNAT family N-acetyltransferase [Mangrovihabitans endophyticus]|uniref:N-acetyltransferase domain-containing protein n=1 Tax=Mangrovihabitans endophyticus TaxID=1751298 RepID=A0A8J3BYC7_9ACTN|nr:GNAT family N-acetyltransferase [Mangrovihabitans endophyticus]GGK82435.1 hypothetical protein GCM10012284_15490 [Mangrovihabitans endophyticus]
MANFRIRQAHADDAPAVVALRSRVYPYLVRGVASTRRMISIPLPREDRATFVAETEGEVVGWVSAYRNLRAAQPDIGQISLLHVHPEHRRRGIGDALLSASAGHLRAVGIRRAAATTTVEALGFAERYGFRPVRELRYARLDLSLMRAGPPVVPEGLRLVPLHDVDERALYEADVAAASDEPGDVAAAPAPFELWRHDVWADDELDRDASTAVMAGSEVVSFALLTRDGDRAWSDMTATVPARRRRGLARLAKAASLRHAAAGGVRAAYTGNDESNAAMVAVNAGLGYRVVATQVSGMAAL